MKNGNGKIDTAEHDRLDYFVAVGNRAVLKAREENLRLGLPNVIERDGKLVFEMPDGSIVIKEIAPAK